MADEKKDDDPPPPPLTMKEELKALRAFARALDRMEPHARRAAVRWLIDSFHIDV